MNLSRRVRGSRKEDRVRAMRAYLAGLGTAGSLVAGAALLFVLASAFVAFRGSPEMASGPAPAAVVVSPPSIGGARTARGRALATAVAARAPAAPRARGPRLGVPGAAARAAGGAPPSPGGSSRVFVAAPTGHVAAPPQRPVYRCASGCGTPPPPAAPALSGPVRRATSGLGQGASALGAKISGTADSAAAVVQRTSPAAASAVESAGALAGGALSSAGGALSSAGGALSSAGGALPGH
jgi:hypothetical protein